MGEKSVRALVLGHMVKGDLESARFVWKRAPEPRRAADEELRAAFAVLQAMWARDYPAAHAALRWGGWSPAAAPVVAHLAGKFRADTVALLTKVGRHVQTEHCLNPGYAAHLTPPRLLSALESKCDDLLSSFAFNS